MRGKKSLPHDINMMMLVAGLCTQDLQCLWDVYPTAGKYPGIGNMLVGMQGEKKKIGIVSGHTSTDTVCLSD